jgi:hypothetical protein
MMDYNGFGPLYKHLGFHFELSFTSVHNMIFYFLEKPIDMGKHILLDFTIEGSNFVRID